jgi:hypothetical protein
MTKGLIVPVETKTDPLVHRRINRAPVNVESIEAMTPDMDKKVRGTFVNIECPGQPAKISCKLYKGMQYFSETFLDNGTYTIPLSVARHINERCKAFKHSYLMDDKGNPIKEEKPTARYKFIVEGY